MNLIDFHVHGKGSIIKDKFANASYDDMCSFFQGVAEEEDKDVVVAFTDHDNVAITYDEFKTLREKYPRVKIVLGMESNAKLSYSTNSLFERAHVLLYADMSSEEGIKKWFDCKELQALSKINTFVVRFPSPYLRTKTYVDNLNSMFRMHLDSDTIASKFEKLPSDISGDKIKSLFVKYIAELLYSAKDNDTLNATNFYENILKYRYNNSSNWNKITFDDIYEEISNIPFLNQQLSTKYLNLGNSLYVAKNILDKHFGVKISNIEIAMFLDKAKSYEQMRNDFLKIVRYKIQKHKPELFEKIKDLTLNQFANYKFGEWHNGPLKLNAFFPKGLNDEWAMGRDNIQYDVRTRLSELDTIAKKTGGYLMLAHPNSMFTFSNKDVFTKEDFAFIKKGIISDSKYEELENEFKSTDKIPYVKVRNKTSKRSKLLKLDLFFNVCKSKGINFAGFEITKSDLNNKSDLINKLIYASKNGYEVSFGSDTHLSKSEVYYRLYLEHKISKNKFAKLKRKLVDQGDTIAENSLYTNLYGEKSTKDISFENDSFVHKIKTPILKNHPDEPIYASKKYNRVLEASFVNKVFNGEQNEDDKTMFALDIKGTTYVFKKETLKDMKYVTGNENKAMEKDENEEIE